MSGKHRKEPHRPTRCGICRKHLQSLGTDVLVGAAVVLLPMVQSDEFDWSAGWWKAASGILLRRILIIFLMYIIRVFLRKEQHGEDGSESDTGDDHRNHQ